MTKEHPTSCGRPFCFKPVTAIIPLPSGSRCGDIYVCAEHEEDARTACYYLVSIDGTLDEGFDARTWAKHIALRGSRMLYYV